MNETPAQKGYFDQTLWSTIVKAQRGEEHTRSAALERLITRYRTPIILHIRQKQSCNALEGEELAHEFLARWISKNILESVDERKGRFRTFLKSCIDHFLIDLARKRNAQSRQPAAGVVSLDETNGEGAPLRQPPGADALPGDQMDVAWAHEVVNRALARLEETCVASGRGNLFSKLKPTLCGDPSAESHSAIATALGSSEGAIKVAYHRLKDRLGEIIRDEISETVGSREDADSELKYLIRLVGQ